MPDKFSKLTNEELQFLNDNLNKSELVIYLYIRIQSHRNILEVEV